MEGAFTFNVLVLSGKSKWTSFSRWESASDARAEAQNLVAGRKHAGVKIVQEHFDEAKNRFMERTIFKKLKRADSSYEDDLDEDEIVYAPYEDYDSLDDRGRGMVILGSILAVAAVALALGWFVTKESEPSHKRSGEEHYFVYDLPVVVTNIMSGGKTYSLKVNLQLELDNRDDAKAVEFALAQVMESVIDQLQETDAGDLRKTERIQKLRRILQKKIQDAVGETHVNGVLFRDIQVF